MENIKISWFDITIIVLLCIISDDTMFFGTNDASFVLPFRAVFYSLTIVFYGVKCHFRINKKAGFAFLLIFVSVLLTVIVNNYFTQGYTFYLLGMLLGLIVVSYFPFDIFVTYFIKIMFFSSCLSLFLYFLYIIYPTYVIRFPTITNSAGNEYFNLIFSVFPKKLSLDIRNYSFFREPGIYAMYLCFALLLILFCDSAKMQLKKVRYSIVFIISILTTLSTAGYLFLFSIIFLFLLLRNKFLTVLFLLVSVLLFGLVLIDTPFDKFNSDSLAYMSTLSRISSAILPLYIIIVNPFTGVGLDSFVSLYETYSYTLFSENFSASGTSTNTILNIMAIFGIPIGLAITYLVYLFTKNVTKNRFLSSSIFIVLIMMLSTQELRYSFLFTIIIMYGAKK